MEIKQVLVTREKPEEIFSVIEKELLENAETQVFVETEVYDVLRWHGTEHHVYYHNLEKCYHYYDDDGVGGEDWIVLTKGCYHDDCIACGSFIANTTDYMQLVEFHSPQIEQYTHYLTGFKCLLLVAFKEEG